MFQNKWRAWAVVVALAIILTGVFATVGKAQAHTPEVKVTCSTLKVTLTNYNSRHPNKVSVTIDGVSAADAEFGSAYTRTFTLSPDYQAHTWKVDVDAWDSNQYDLHKSGTTVPCERPKPLQPPDQTEYRHWSSPTDCTVKTIVTGVETRTRTFVFDEQSWTWVAGDWSAWALDRSNLHSTANAKYPCPKPPAVKPPTHFTPHIRVIDRCRCKHDNVRVKHDGRLQFVSVRQVSKTKWVVRVIADEGVLIPAHIKSATSKWVRSATYTFRTTNKPCPCEKTGCKPKPKPKPPVPCACRP